MYVKTVDQGNGGPVHVYVVLLYCKSEVLLFQFHVKLRFYC